MWQIFFLINWAQEQRDRRARIIQYHVIQKKNNVLRQKKESVTKCCIKNEKEHN